MSQDDYTFDEDDVKGGGSRGAKPIGYYEGIIDQAETAKDKNGMAYLKFRLDIRSGPQKAGYLFENYLPLAKREVRGGKDKGQVKLDARTVSFLRATGQARGIPVGAPSGRPASDLNGTIVGVRVDHEYQNVPGRQYPLKSWERDFDDVEGSGALKGIQPRESLGFYSISDEFFGIGPADGSEGDLSAEDVWG